MREICLDTETTGMAAKEGDRIIEIGCVELGEHGLTDKNFHEYIDPERQMEAEVIRVHKITNEFLVGTSPTSSLNLFRAPDSSFTMLSSTSASSMRS